MNKMKSRVLSAILAITAIMVVLAFQAPTPTADSDVVPGPAVNYMILAEFDGIPGESTVEDYEDWIYIQSFNYGMGMPSRGSTGMSRRRSDVVFEDIVLTKWVDKSTPKLMDAVAKGIVIPTVDIHFIRAGTDDLEFFYKYELKNVLVTSLQSSGHVEEYLPTDTITFNYEEIKVTYQEFDDDGDPQGLIEWSWDIEEGEG